jgi:hypothetical protein
VTDQMFSSGGHIGELAEATFLDWKNCCNKACVYDQPVHHRFDFIVAIYTVLISKRGHAIA